MSSITCSKSIRTHRLWVFLLGLMGFLLISPAHGMERERTSLVLHLRVQSDIDSAALVRELIEHLQGLDREGYVGMLLELESGRVRDDLAWSLGAAIDEADRPVWVWLTRGDGGRAGPNQLELAIRAEGAWIDPRASVAWDGPGEDVQLAPEDLVASRMMRERHSALWVALERRGANTRLAEGLLRPSTPVRARWLVDGECELVEGPVEPGQDAGLHTLVEPLADGGTRGRISARLAVALGLVDGAQRSSRDVLREALGDAASRGWRTRPVVLKSDLDAVIERSHRLMTRARAEAALASDTLRRRIERGLGASAYERAVQARARETLEVIERGEAALRGFERLVAEHPEVLRTRAPMQADLPGVEETAARAWAREIEHVRRSLAGIRADAMAQAKGSP